MKFFKDKELKQEIINFDLGIVEAGSTKEFHFYVYNDENSFLDNLNFKLLSIDSRPIEANIKKAPKSLRTGELEEFSIEYSPSISLKKGLKANINITGNEIFE